MPRISARRQLLSSLDAMILLQVSLLASTTTVSSPTTATFIPNLISCLMMVSFMNSDDDDEIDESDDNIGHRELTFIFAYTVMMLTTLEQGAYINKRKRKLEADESILGVLLTIQEEARRRRYPLPRHRRPRCSQKAQCFQDWFDETDRTWMSVARIRKEDFTKLLHRIGSSPIFYNNSNHDQDPVQWQLLVTLANFGLSGNGGSRNMKAKTFSVSEGSVDNYTKRCIIAILELESEYVRWPNAEERVAIKRRIGRTSWFQDCVGFIDGTLVPLAAAPSKNKEDYYTRKSIYALNSLIICDDQRRVIYAHHGWCGSAHDQRVLKSTNFYKDMPSFFSEGEYILADSGYASSKHIVPVFKRSRFQGLAPSQTHFNNAISKIRIASEHCNGMLQMRFGSLHELRLAISNAKDAVFVCDWISACVVVHNFVIVEGTPMAGINLNNHSDLDFIDDTIDHTDAALRRAELESVGSQRRNSLFRAYCIDKGY